MTKTVRFILPALLLASIQGMALAQDGTAKRFAIRGTVGPDFVAGDSTLRKRDRVGPAVGGMASFHFMPNLGFGFSYDRLDITRLLQPEMMTLNLILRPMTTQDRQWYPFVHAGGGWGHIFQRDETRADNKWAHVAVKAGLGIERVYENTASLGAVVNYHYIDGKPLKLHVIVPALVAGYHF